jgi:signal transduction histidine kinase
MKLLVKATLFYLLLILIVFGMGGIMTYDIFQRQIQIETDRYLVQRLWSLQNSIENGEKATAFNNDKQTIIEIDNKFAETRFAFSDTLADNPSPAIDRLEPHRKLTVIRKIHEKTYKIELFDVIVESDDIFTGVFQALTRLFIILGIVLVMASLFISRWLFRPFNITLQAIKSLRFQEQEQPIFGKSRTQEFRELNSILEQMVLKNKADYKNLKEFSENASHELQTPIAVAKGKLELLLQSKNLDEDQLMLINSVNESIDHMSKMSRALSLLTKIGNKEFSEMAPINLTEKIRNLAYNFQELFDLKNIEAVLDIEENVIVNGDKTLFQILINNLLQNAVRYNIPGGKINIGLTKSTLRISNTGNPLKTAPIELFKRFKKDIQSSENIGLGLSIVKKICDVSGYRVNYEHADGLHVLTVVFK